MGAKPFWFSVNLLTQCLQGLIVCEDQNVEEFHVQVTKVEELVPGFYRTHVKHVTHIRKDYVVGVRLRYLGAILDHPIRRQNFAGTSISTTSETLLQAGGAHGVRRCARWEDVLRGRCAWRRCARWEDVEDMLGGKRRGKDSRSSQSVFLPLACFRNRAPAHY